MGKVYIFESHYTFFTYYIKTFIMNQNILNKLDAYVDSFPNTLDLSDAESKIGGYVCALKDFVYIRENEWIEYFTHGTMRYMQRILACID